MGEYVKVGRNLQVASVLFEFINKDGLPGSGLNQEQFWVDFEKLVHDMSQKTKNISSSVMKFKPISIHGTGKIKRWTLLNIKHFTRNWLSSEPRRRRLAILPQKGSR